MCVQCNAVLAVSTNFSSSTGKLAQGPCRSFIAVSVGHGGAEVHHMLIARPEACTGSVVIAVICFCIIMIIVI